MQTRSVPGKHSNYPYSTQVLGHDTINYYIHPHEAGTKWQANTTCDQHGFV